MEILRIVNNQFRTPATYYPVITKDNSSNQRDLPASDDKEEDSFIVCQIIKQAEKKMKMSVSKNLALEIDDEGGEKTILINEAVEVLKSNESCESNPTLKSDIGKLWDANKTE